MQVKGADLIAPDGNKFFIVGTNLGNWLNPEGYMFGFQRMNAPRQINDLFSHLTSSLRHPKRQDNQTMASMTDVRVSAS